MNSQEYYKKISKNLKNCFQYNDCIISIEKELVNEGCNPAFPAITVPKSKLKYLTEERGFQVHIPVIGAKSQSVLMPMDFEIYLCNDNYKLYTDKESQKYYFNKTVPVLNFIKKLFTDRGMPFLLDYTPSGGHILFQNPLNQRSSKELQQMGYLESDLIRACKVIDPNNLRRKKGISLEAASVFSGLGKIAEYISLLTMSEFKNNEAEGRLPVTISDSKDNCINLDNSWCEGSPHMRSIRSPYSLHKKNQEKYGRDNDPPLVDVIGCYFDGEVLESVIDINTIIDCMWDLNKAAEHGEKFTGVIPAANDNLIDFIGEYKKSDLYSFHQEFDAEKDLNYGEAIYRAKKENNIPDWSRTVLYNPNPAALQPIKMIGLIYDFVIRAKWKPKHAANILRDLYMDNNNGWTQDFVDSYPAEEKANFWGRTFGALAYWNTGKINI
ncbi:MAG TPA: hypothetical protein QF753_21105 [Victivallales bacterium]|nr:hypothetical protein [Victivallales bacterium]